jgi:hypothetical protein
MLHCEKYKADIPDKTCITRMEILAKHSGKGAWGFGGAQSCMKYEGCTDCEIGKKLYEKHLKGEPMKEKFCNTCKKPLPADQNHFDTANRAADKLTKDCKVCRGSEYSSLDEGIKKKDDGIIPTKIKISDPVPAEPKVLQTRIVVDFADHTDIYEKLKVKAGINLRTPRKQALWMMIEALKEVG